MRLQRFFYQIIGNRGFRALPCPVSWINSDQAFRLYETSNGSSDGSETMSFYKSNLGSFGGKVQADINGYVPTEDTGPWELSYDHGSEQTHDDSGELTEYGKWWETERFPEIKAAAIETRRRRIRKLVEAVKQRVRKV